MAFPDLRARPAFRLGRDLAPTTAFANTNVKAEVVPVAGSARLRVHLKTATAGGTLDIVLMGPDTDPNLKTGTQYTTGNPTQVSVTAGTEAKIDVDLYGESYALVKFTGGGTGTITYCDVSQV